eukprot:SRR837773.3173.p2 GENE.SRR837773.3173~~SRR837773.3173.p2  ORF type:complete len:140 (-),score=29.88 SRR837773.3173:220-639(-)
MRPQTEGFAAGGWQNQFFQRQSQLASQLGAGWFFWSYKMAREDWPHWSFRQSFERGWISRPSAAGLALSKASAAEPAVVITSQVSTDVPDSASVGDLAEEEDEEDESEDAAPADEAAHMLPLELMQEVVSRMIFPDLPL